MSTIPELPDYDSLPRSASGFRSGWGVFGDGDNVGLLNLITPQRIAAAARLVRTGEVLPLDAPYDAFVPPIAPHRLSPLHSVIHETGSLQFDDRYDNYFPQGSSQWDSLGHVGAGVEGFYNGATEEDIVTGRRNTIEHWAARGIVGRGVLLDLSGILPGEFGPDEKVEIGVDQLEDARKASGVEYEPGDILVLHTGFTSWYLNQPETTRAAVRGSLNTVGLEANESMCRYLWNSHAAALGTDTFGVEAFPPQLDQPFGFLHRILIGRFGMALGELWSTSALAEACASDGRFTFLFASAPMNAPGGIGSPANALAIR